MKHYGPKERTAAGGGQAGSKGGKRMEKLEYTVKFITPAFLGNAEQRGQWRTPPFKALLRQWWRVAYAADKEFNVNIAEMRREEGLLFGNAWLSHREGNKDVADYSKSLVRLRLTADSDNRQEPWGAGSQDGVQPLQTNLATSYAWFGIARRGNNQPDRKGIKADAAERARVLQIRVPKKYYARIESTVKCIDFFGTIGSRARGAWGSLRVNNIQPLTDAEILRYARPVRACLNQDWALSLGRDKNGLCIWESSRFFSSWDRTMQKVAIDRRNVRTALKMVQGRDLRSTLGFAGNGRMASPLCWKVFENDEGKLGIRIFAMPHRLPEASGKTLSGELLAEAWEKISEALDQSDAYSRKILRGGAK